MAFWSIIAKDIGCFYFSQEVSVKQNARIERGDRIVKMYVLAGTGSLAITLLENVFATQAGKDTTVQRVSLFIY